MASVLYSIKKQRTWRPDCTSKYRSNYPPWNIRKPRRPCAAHFGPASAGRALAHFKALKRAPSPQGSHCLGHGRFPAHPWRHQPGRHPEQALGPFGRVDNSTSYFVQERRQLNYLLWTLRQMASRLRLLFSFFPVMFHISQVELSVLSARRSQHKLTHVN